MADEGVFKVIFQTSAEVGGAEKQTAAIREQTAAVRDLDAAQKQAAASSGFQIGASVPIDRGALAEQNAQIAASLKALEAEAAGEAAVTAEQSRQAVLRSELLGIARMEAEAAIERAAGNEAEALDIEREIVLRKEVLTLQRLGLTNEEEAYAIASQRLAAEELIKRQEVEQAALNRTLIAEEEARLALAKQQALQEAAIAKEKAAQALQTQRAATRGLFAGIGGGLGLTEVAVQGASVLGTFLAVELAVRGVKLAFETLNGLTAADEIKAVADKSTDLATSTERAAKNLEALEKGFARAAAEATRLRKAQDELANAQLASDLANVDLAEAQKTITPEQATEQRTRLRRDAKLAELDRSDLEQRQTIDRNQRLTGKTDMDARRARDRAADTQGVVDNLREQGAGGDVAKMREELNALRVMTNEEGYTTTAADIEQIALLEKRIALTEQLNDALRVAEKAGAAAQAATKIDTETKEKARAENDTAVSRLNANQLQRGATTTAAAAADQQNINAITAAARAEAIIATRKEHEAQKRLDEDNQRYLNDLGDANLRADKKAREREKLFDTSNALDRDVAVTSKEGQDLLKGSARTGAGELRSAFKATTDGQTDEEARKLAKAMEQFSTAAGGKDTQLVASLRDVVAKINKASAEQKKIAEQLKNARAFETEAD